MENEKNLSFESVLNFNGKYMTIKELVARYAAESVKPRRPVRIKQLLPLPVGYVAAREMCQPDDEYALEGTSHLPVAYCVALVDGGSDEDDYTALMEVGAYGGNIDKVAELLPVMHCPHCGKEMHVVCREKDSDGDYLLHIREYDCKCGYWAKVNDWEGTVETNENEEEEYSDD